MEFTENHNVPFHLVLYQPVIPQNTGSIARLCACTGAVLHLIHPLGFRTDEATVKRAGLDYWPHVDVREHPDWETFLAAEKPERLFFFSKFSRRSYATARFEATSYLVFGSETKGLPDAMRDRYPDAFFQVPMRTHLVRSLNLAQCAAVVLYEALRQKRVCWARASIMIKWETVDPIDAQRRELLTQLLKTIATFCAASLLARCGFIGGGGDDPSTTTYTSSVVSGHTHTITLTALTLAAPPANGFSGPTSMSQGHVHQLFISGDQLTLISSLATVAITTSNTNGHAHVFNFNGV